MTPSHTLTRTPLRRHALGTLLLAVCALWPLLPASSQDVDFRQWLLLPPLGRSGRAAVTADPISAQIARGQWSPPTAGQEEPGGGNTPRRWEQVTAAADGWVNHRSLQGGYAYTSVDAKGPEIRLLEVSGHGSVRINGELRVGDPYATGYVRLPVALQVGRNDLLFSVPRGRVRAKWLPVHEEAAFNTGDLTLPDVVPDIPGPLWGGVVVLNLSQQNMTGLRIRSRCAGGRELLTDLPPIPPLTLRKCGFQIQVKTGDRYTPDRKDVPLELGLERRGKGKSRVLDKVTPTLRLRRLGEVYRRTFVSEIDGSVQYYAVNPMRPGSPVNGRPALFLTLHGASVEAQGQAEAYSPKSWGHLVAPTNRRPYGFDWEDWGRLDALEVLRLAKLELNTDPRRTYLTGHSMGGHGAWHLAATSPGEFAAVGPSAGWVSFFTYAGGVRPVNPDPVQELMQRAAAPSDTPLLLRNYGGMGVYVLHGDADDNVPVAQARQMRELLGTFHKDWQYHEQPGAGHWWDASDEAGADCVDWAPMFDYFSRHSLPTEEEAREVELTTVNPGITSRSRWLEIWRQIRPLQMSRAKLRWDPLQRRFTGTTENVARLALHLGRLRPAGSLVVVLDGETLSGLSAPSAGAPLHLERVQGRWRLAAAPSPDRKSPERCGPFKQAFQHRPLLVYGTRGTAEENAWSYQRARYDAETFWYRGNGSFELRPDTDFDSSKERDRSVVIYGNADTNSAWSSLLGGGPIDVRRGEIRLGERTMRGEELAALFIQPRPGSSQSLVAAVAGSGLVGCRLTERLAYLSSGVAYPDWLILGPDVLTRGAQGILGAGFFSAEWKPESGESAWKTLPDTVSKR